jgi:hypothetical protein
MSARQPIPTTLPPPHPFDQLNGYAREKVELARSLKALKAHYGDDQAGFEAHLQEINPDLLAPFFFFGPTWAVKMGDADRYDLTDEELLAKCRATKARQYTEDVAKSRCRAPATPGEQTLVDRWLDMHTHHTAVGVRLDHRQPEPPRLRALTKRLAKLGLIYNWRHNRPSKDAPEPKPSRDDQLWAAASRRYPWERAVAEHGGVTARRMWDFARYTRAQNELVRLEAQTARMARAFDPVLDQALVIWNAGGKGATAAVLEAIRQTGQGDPR